MKQKSNEPKKSVKKIIFYLITQLISLTAPANKKSVIEAVDVIEPKAAYITGCKKVIWFSDSDFFKIYLGYRCILGCKL